MSHLAAEIGLRLAKAGLAAVLALVLYLVLTGPFDAAATPELALLSWLAASTFILLVETSPL